MWKETIMEIAEWFETGENQNPWKHGTGRIGQVTCPKNWVQTNKCHKVKIECQWRSHCKQCLETVSFFQTIDVSAGRKKQRSLQFVFASHSELLRIDIHWCGWSRNTKSSSIGAICWCDIPTSKVYIAANPLIQIRRGMPIGRLPTAEIWFISQPCDVYKKHGSYPDETTIPVSTCTTHKFEKWP